MDIKDFILIGGGLLIAAVVAHGCWIAWRARRDPLRLDLVTDLPAESADDDDLKRLRAELPNGGARVVKDDPRQASLDLDRVPGVPSDPAGVGVAAADDVSGDDALLGEAPPAVGQDDAAQRSTRRRAPEDGAKTEPRLGPAPATDRRDRPAVRRDKVKDVILPERGAKAEQLRERRWSSHRTGAEGGSSGQRQSRAGAEGGTETRKNEQGADELIVLSVLAPKGKPFVGPALVETLRERGLRYGDMNIFHRLEPMTRTTLYSVANVVEPGTFDMADLDDFRSPGVCFFMRLPGPEQPMDAFEDMLKVARAVAVRVGGELKDEQRSVMTGQTVEHYRQRISDFCRRRMSMRA